MNNRKFSKRRKRSEYKSSLLDLARVTRVTSGGRRLRFRAVMVVGDQKGKVGLGVSKGETVRLGIDKARNIAEKSLLKISLKNGTIAYPVQGDFGSSSVLLKPKTSGGGLTAGGTVRTVCEMVGIENISAKILSRSKNKLNIARATLKALEKLE